MGGKGNKRNNSNSNNSNNKKADRQIKAALRRRKERLQHGGETWKKGIRKFEEQLNPLGLYIKDVAGDGNCLFRSIADQLEDAPNLHRKYRENICKFIEMNKDQFIPFVDTEEFGSFEEYIEEMREDATWGGHIEIQACSLAYEINITIHQLDQPRWEVINHFPVERKKMINLSYHNDEHYNSVRSISKSTLNITNNGNNNNNSPIPNFDYNSNNNSNNKNNKNKNNKNNNNNNNNNNSYNYYDNSYEDYDLQDSISQIIDVTGVTDLTLIKDALKDCQNDIQAAIEYLFIFKTPESNNDSDNNSNQNENKTTTTTTTTTTTSTSDNKKVSKNPYKGVKKMEQQKKKEEEEKEKEKEKENDIDNDNDNVHLSNKQRKQQKQQQHSQQNNNNHSNNNNNINNNSNIINNEVVDTLGSLSI